MSEVEKRIYLEQVLTALALTTINSQEAAIISGIPMSLNTIQAKIHSLVSNYYKNSLHACITVDLGYSESFYNKFQDVNTFKSQT